MAIVYTGIVSVLLAVIVVTIVVVLAVNAIPLCQ